MNEHELGVVIGKLDEVKYYLEKQIEQIRDDFKDQSKHFEKIYGWLETHDRNISSLKTMQKVIVGAFSFIIATVAGWLGLK